jgi:hypothetical protein
MGGPSDRQFHASKGVHVTPVVDYLGFPPDREENRRRSVYGLRADELKEYLKRLDPEDFGRFNP